MIRAARDAGMVGVVVVVVVIAAVAGSLLMMMPPAAGAATVEVLSQARGVAASTNVEINGVTDSKSDSQDAPDAGPFNGAASADATAADAGQTINGFATASQDSSLLASRFSFSGRLTAGGLLSGLDGVNSFDFDASTATDATINFRLHDTRTLQPTLNISDNFEATRENSTFVFEVTAAGGELVADFRNLAAVDLEPGDYTLSFNYAFGPTNNADFESKEADYEVAVDFVGAAIPLPPGVALGCAGLLFMSPRFIRRALGGRGLSGV